METSKTFINENFEKLCNYMEKETVGAEAIVYGTSGLMLLIAYAKRKPTYLVRQFKKPSHIPDKIINERVMHTGLIQDIQQQNQDTLLLIKHRPWLPIFTSQKQLLPVKLPGIKVNGNGYAWLQNCLVGRQATFLPLQKGKHADFVVCQLCLVHPPKGNKLLDISETLLKLRFAKYAEDTAAKAKSNVKYYKYLQKVESNTQSKESWISWTARHPWIWNAFNELRASLLPKQKLLPELVR